LEKGKREKIVRLDVLIADTKYFHRQ